ncbi:MAG: hypothetical protein ACSHW7_12485 [Patiriisocius sp.]|uniref:hypothetical protein n=1 Tax=Patiriisocius sp. TaxID=2822396 RepID=UPI003EF93078
MKKVIILLALALCTHTLYAQEENEQRGLFVQSISLAPGVWGDFDSDFRKEEGLAISVDVTANYHSHLFTFYASSLQEVHIFGNSNNTSIVQIGAYYGREFTIAPWFRIEGHLGPSIVITSYSNPTTDFNRLNETTLGYGGRAKLLFYPTPSRRFGFGPHAQVNLNSVLNTGMVGLNFQFKLK